MFRSPACGCTWSDLVENFGRRMHLSWDLTFSSTWYITLWYHFDTGCIERGWSYWQLAGGRNHETGESFISLDSSNKKTTKQNIGWLCPVFHLAGQGADEILIRTPVFSPHAAAAEEGEGLQEAGWHSQDLSKSGGHSPGHPPLHLAAPLVTPHLTPYTPDLHN